MISIYQNTSADVVVRMKFLISTQHISLTIIFLSLLINPGCSRSPDHYFPLTEGSYWRYVMSYNTMDGHFKGVYAVENLSTKLIDDQRTYVRKELGGTLMYYRKDDDGILLVGHEKVSDFSTKFTEEKQYVYQYPLEAGVAWQDETFSKALIKTGPPQKTEFHIIAKVPVTVKIESITDTVEVPAGIFDNCMRISYSGDAFTDAGNYIGLTVVSVNETNWYAPGVGLVKSVRRETTTHQALDHGEIVLELESYRL